MPQPRPRTHAFTGCGNCRDRHVKCDLGTPSCKNCSRLKLECQGYVKKFAWMPWGPNKVTKHGRRVTDLESVDDVEEIQSSRRVLFSGLSCAV